MQLYATTIRRVIWRRLLDDRSFEECIVTGVPDGVVIAGRVMAAQDGAPLTMHYEIDCDNKWSARSVTIGQRLGDAQRRLQLQRSGDGWLVDGVRVSQLDGCAEP